MTTYITYMSTRAKFDHYSFDTKSIKDHFGHTFSEKKAKSSPTFGLYEQQEELWCCKTHGSVLSQYIIMFRIIMQMQFHTLLYDFLTAEKITISYYALYYRVHGLSFYSLRMTMEVKGHW